jgi:uroporphyrinogen-III synthase
VGIRDKSSIYLISTTPYEGVHHLPLLNITYLNPTIDFTLYDTLLFTSKQAVKALFEQYSIEKKFTIITIGAATQKCVETYGHQVTYVASKNDANSLAKEIKKHFYHQKILYLRPKEVAYDIAQNMENIDAVTLYQTTCNPCMFKAPPKKSILIFTSPKLVDCFMKIYPLEGYNCIAIGETTKASFPTHITVLTPESPSIAKAIQLASKIH